MTRGTLIWFGVAVVVLAFFASFAGSWLARSVQTEPVPVATASPTTAPAPIETELPDYEEALAEILPAGSAVRAGSGAPEPGKGYEGDVYIDIVTSDVYLFQDDWTLVGNIRSTAAEKLSGQQGPAGETGAEGPAGPSGAPGDPGAPGTQVLLGTGAPAADACREDGDIYIDTASLEFYDCQGGAWALFGPTPTPSPAAG